MTASSATTLDLRSSVCIRLMDTSLHSHTLYLNTDWELPKTRWLDHELTPLPRPQLHAWAWSPTSSEGRQGIRVFVSSPTQGPGGWRSVSKGHPPYPSVTSWITWLVSQCLSASELSVFLKVRRCYKDQVSHVLFLRWLFLLSPD